MTTVQTMLFRVSRRVSLILMGGALALGAACTDQKGVLVAPETLVAPYDSSRGDVLWAIAPFDNESGVSLVQTDRLVDALAAGIDEARGLSCLPLNRSLAAMRALGLYSIQSPQQARMLANALGADGVIVGSITAWDPYDPPKIGYKLALFSRDAGANASRLDPMRLHTAYTDHEPGTPTYFEARPVAVVSEHLDGANHEVLMAIKRYAAGRHNPESALGWRSTLMSMDLYTEFAAWCAVSRLLEQERLRIGQPAQTAAETPR